MMNDMLYNLNRDELLLLTKVKKIVGPIEDIVIQLKKNGVINKYQEIYLSYNDIYSEFKNLEALKRMTFLQWYAVSEPTAFTGIDELDNEVQRNNMQLVKDLIDEGIIDQEFKIMLLRYYAVSSWYFDSFFDFSNIKKLMLNEIGKSIFAIDFENRGQMGKYWQSLNKTIK